MQKRLSILVIMALFAAVALGQSEDQKEEKGGGTEQDRVKESGEVLKQILDTPDKGIPKSVLDGAKCVIILPSVKKVAIGIGGSYGRGVMTCRGGSDFQGPWGAPSMIALGGGSFGFQVGGQATDFVLLLMNERAASSILASKVKLGATASVAAVTAVLRSSTSLQVIRKEVGAQRC